MKYLFSLLAVLLGLSASAVNLIPNSSFETGANRGWLEYGTSGSAFGGNISFFKGQLTNDAFNGANAMTIIGPLVGRAIWLTNGTYVFSIYAKSPSGLSGPFYFGMMNGAELAAVSIPPTNVNVAGTWTRYTSTFVANSNAFYFPKFTHFQTLFLVDAIQLEPGTSLSGEGLV